MSGGLVDWSTLVRRLALLANGARPARLVSVSVALDAWPEVNAPAHGDWFSWQRPDRALRLLGIGKAVTTTTGGEGRFAALHAAHAGLAADWRHDEDVPPPLACLGFAFAPRGGGPLPNACLWVPELMLREEAGRALATFSCAAADADAAPARWRALWRTLTEAAVPPTAAAHPEACRHPLAERAFLARGRAALRAIDAGIADKLVLTRSLRLRAEHALAVAPVLATLAAQHPACATFGVGRNGRAFVGASPETLLRIEGERVEVDALAGTAWFADACEADRPATLSLAGDKNRREHDFVVRAVVDGLGSLCEDVATPAVSEVLRFDALEHLCRRVTAARRAGVSALDLIARLHPTPAVGGTPTPAALDWLAAHGDRRGAWYTGGIGWIDAAGNADVSVALRCGLLHGREATLFAGAGFVAGSEPAQELAETEAKFSVMRAALASGVQARARKEAA